MKTAFKLFLSALMGLILCNIGTAQVFNGQRINSGLLNRLNNLPQFKPQAQAAPSIPQGFQMPQGIRDSVLSNIKFPGQPGSMLTIPQGPLKEFNPSPAPQPVPPQNGGGVTFNFGPQGPSLGIGTHNGGQFNIPLRPGMVGNQPIYQSPGQVLGYGPQGQIYTGDGQVMGSAFAPGRNMSQHNGTQQVVQKPMYDNFGNIVGYQSGTVWRNSLTGQQHGNMTTYTPNGSGGHHQSTTQFSTAGGNITPIQN